MYLMLAITQIIATQRLITVKNSSDLSFFEHRIEHHVVLFNISLDAYLSNVEYLLRQLRNSHRLFNLQEDLHRLIHTRIRVLNGLRVLQGHRAATLLF